MSNRIPCIATLSLTLLAVACGEQTPTTPTPPPVPVTLAITCPAAVAASSIDGAPVAVSFAAPAVIGGTAPVTTICTPASGTSFSVGTTTSSCTAKDSASTPNTASCSVSISVAKVPKLSVTSIEAFGDSITQGVFSDCTALAPVGPLPARSRLDFQQLLDVSRSYPTRLQSLLKARYTAQNISVNNAGQGGERVDEAPARLTATLNAVRPEVLLLQEGANNVTADDSAIFIAAGLRELVKRGQSAGARVFVGALLPERPTDTASCRTKGWNAAKVAEINQAIRNMAAGEGVAFVDLYGVFGGVPGDLIGSDGLHPTDAGYDKIAATFFDAITQRFEN